MTTTAEVTVLVVEDEPLIRETLEEVLGEAGYAVTAAATGEEALRLLNAEGQDFRALVTDINLSGKATGWHVAHRARELTPSLPIVYMSGGSANEWSANGVPGSILLTKPFAMAQVVTAVSNGLNEVASRGALAPG